MGVACLFTLQGIPCLYYGTEQGLHGSGTAMEAVREALWGKPGGFDRDHPFFQAIRQASAVRQQEPALRYGRQYFRPISGNGAQFGMSAFAPGVLAFSRILHEDEVVVIANTNPRTMARHRCSWTFRSIRLARRMRLSTATGAAWAMCRLRPWFTKGRAAWKSTTWRGT